MSDISPVTSTPEQGQTIGERLREPFSPDDVQWKPQAVSKDGAKALAVAYIDARAVMNRLDDVLGVDGWQDSYEVLPSLTGAGDGNKGRPKNSVVCKLRIRIDGEWVEKSDVGGESSQPDEGDRLKSAFSDALKRAAVKLGVGRYLYDLPLQWVDYDGQKRRFKHSPSLPKWALPRGYVAPAGVNRQPQQLPESDYDGGSAPDSNGKPRASIDDVVKKALERIKAVQTLEKFRDIEKWVAAPKRGDGSALVFSVNHLRSLKNEMAAAYARFAPQPPDEPDVPGGDANDIPF